MSDNRCGENIFPILSMEDPRIEPYRNLKDRELARQGGLFIAEGEHLVRRLLKSDYKTESLFLSNRRVDEIRRLCRRRYRSSSLTKQSCAASSDSSFTPE